MTKKARYLLKSIIVSCMVFGALLISTATVKAASSVSVTLETGKGAAYDNYKALQGALDKASSATSGSPLTVKISGSGTYYIAKSSGGALKIRSNTTLNLNGATLVRHGEMKNLVQNADSKGNQSAGGYGLSENITIKNGTLDGSGGDFGSRYNVVNFGHADNVKFSDVSFKNCYGAHLIELCGCSNSTVSDCTFTGWTLKSGDTKSDHEAIQLDIAYNGANCNWNGTFKSDKTPCKNITIDGCQFKDYPSGVGNHHTVNGYHNTNIKITNNTFKNTLAATDPAIWAFGFDNSKISGNKITGNYTRAIYVASGDVDVIDNSIGSSSSPFNGHGIYCNNAKEYKAGSGSSTTTGYVSGGNIKSNSVYVKGNDEKTGKVSIGLVVYGKSALDEVSSNTIVSEAYYGVHISASGSAIDVLKNNTIKSTKKVGLALTSSGAITSKAEGNTIEGKTRGVQVSSKGRIADFGDQDNGNEISSNGDYGVLVTGSGSKIDAIEGNTITASKGKGIAIQGSGKSSDISYNTVESSGSHGIYVTKTTVTEINYNTVNSCSGSGIYLTSKGKVKNIKYNELKKNKRYGLERYNKSSTLKSNSFSGNKKGSKNK
ncbi:MAG: right-handed parallel beta-helix repeat-containing protein [Erysipelotrichaceae bacterium]|nr:right-handed parallel beta-helix repeat-containing protein [Erysipelotrichaceae bacterium]